MTAPDESNPPHPVARPEQAGQWTIGDLFILTAAAAVWLSVMRLSREESAYFMPTAVGAVCLAIAWWRRQWIVVETLGFGAVATFPIVFTGHMVVRLIRLAENGTVPWWPGVIADVARHSVYWACVAALTAGLIAYNFEVWEPWSYAQSRAQRKRGVKRPPSPATLPKQS